MSAKAESHTNPSTLQTSGQWTGFRHTGRETLTWLNWPTAYQFTWPLSLTWHSSTEATCFSSVTFGFEPLSRLIRNVLLVYKRRHKHTNTAVQKIRCQAIWHTPHVNEPGTTSPLHTIWTFATKSTWISFVVDCWRLFCTQHTQTQKVLPSPVARYCVAVFGRLVIIINRSHQIHLRRGAFFTQAHTGFNFQVKP